MADYIGIKGINIPSLASDPSNPVSGQLWYNTASATLKGYGTQGTGAWASGGTMVSNPINLAGAGHNQSAALAFGGVASGTSSPMLNTVTSYNGTSWTSVPASLNTARKDLSGTGTQTAAMAAAGSAPAKTGATELYNGTSWTTVNALNTARYTPGLLGSTTAALAGGGQAGPGVTAVTEDWNGTSWTEVADINTARRHLGASTMGSPAAGLIFAGIAPPMPASGTAATESWDGASWTEVADLGFARYQPGNGGTQNNAMCNNGYNTPANLAATEVFDGSTWTELANPAELRSGQASGGSITNAFIAGGQTNAPTGTTSEEWTVPDATKTITAS